ncbi:MAG: FKBP-type peptidyl-prolyl cis-trans isomerase [Oscillospiraceae bacterium]|nr:FKBP-type peptidyl-prolyl cis-trans isomerase [Oscillospiraceae bacterium]
MKKLAIVISLMLLTVFVLVAVGCGAPRTVKNGDTVNIDYVGTINGVAFGGGSDQGYNLVIGSGTFIPGFEDQIVGMKVGETRDISVTFPANYTPSLAGQAAVFRVTVNAINGQT